MQNFLFIYNRKNNNSTFIEHVVDYSQQLCYNLNSCLVCKAWINFQESISPSNRIMDPRHFIPANTCTIVWVSLIAECVVFSLHSGLLLQQQWQLHISQASWSLCPVSKYHWSCVWWCAAPAVSSCHCGPLGCSGYLNIVLHA